MERERIPGTLKLWPGVAEEQVATKAHFVRAGLFKDVDVTLFTHVGNNLGVSWGQSGSNALLSVVFKFRGQTSHSAGAPRRGKSALGAVMPRAHAWEMKRGHLALPHRARYVIRWRRPAERRAPDRIDLVLLPRARLSADDGDVRGSEDGRRAALMTDTRVDSINILGSAWSGHFNKTIAEVTQRNIYRVGLPTWDEADLTLARGIQKELGAREVGLETKVDSLGGPVNEATRMGGGSDDIGDVSWNLPTVTLRFPSNIPGLPGHNWANGISMATPIAHKGGVAGAKVQALTLLDILSCRRWSRTRIFPQHPDEDAEVHVLPGADASSAIWLNAEIMAKYRDDAEARL